MKKKLAIWCLLAIFAGLAPLQAQPNSAGQAGSKTITTAVPFLMVAPDSRAGGMGEAGVAIANDANATHWNPAGLAFADKKIGVAMSYSPWLRSLGIPDINLVYFSGFYNIGEQGGVIGGSLRYFSLGQINFTDIQGQPVGSDKPNEFAFDVSYARKISSVLSGAISLRYIHSRLASNSNISGDLKPVNSVAGDLSFKYQKDFTLNNAAGGLPVTFASGINISNIGPKVSYTDNSAEKDFIPVNMRLGYAFTFHFDEYNSLTFTNDFNKLLVPSVDSLGQGGGRSDQALLEGMFGSFGDADEGFSEELREINLAFGLEYWYREVFAIRAGFFNEAEDKGNRQFFTLGGGIKYNVFGLDVAYLAPLEQNHPLQNTLRFTLTYDFAAPTQILEEQ